MDFASGEAMLAPVQRKPKSGGPPAEVASDGSAAGKDKHGKPAAPAPLEGGGEAAAPAPKSFEAWLQGALNRVAGLVDEPLALDGVIGPRTRAAIRKLQSQAATIAPGERPLPVDGRIGPATLGVLERLVGEPNPFGRVSTPKAPAGHGARGEERGGPSATPDEAAAPDKAAAPEGPTVGAEIDIDAPPPPRVQAEVAKEVQDDHKKAGDKGDAPAQDLEAVLKEKLELARAELGKIKEAEFFAVPPLMDDKYAAKCQATLDRRKAEASAAGKKASGVWFAKDPHSLERLVEMCNKAGLNYQSLAADKGYQWCGSFIASHYKLDSKLTYMSDKKPKQKVTTTGGHALASTSKSFTYFNYQGEWEGAVVLDKSVADDAPATERFKPLRAWHAANGGTRGWYPVSEWKANPAEVAKPGMILFVKGVTKYGDHMIFVDYVSDNGKGGFTVHTVEGNAPGAKSAPGKYDIAANGKTEIVACAKPSVHDFDPTLQMFDKDMYEKALEEDAGR